MTSLGELLLADSPNAWRRCGFRVDGDRCLVAESTLVLLGDEAGKGIVGWTLCEAASAELDGLPTRLLDAPATAGEGGPHPNGVTGLDHVVAISPQLERTVVALEAAGLELRRIREEPTPAGAPRQAFFRLGSAILEVVQEPDDVLARNGAERPAFFWGLAFVCPDLEASVAWLGDGAGEIRPAVQPGRRIATLRRSAGLTVPVALMTPAA